MGGNGFTKHNDFGITHQVDELTKCHVERNNYWFRSVLRG